MVEQQDWLKILESTLESTQKEFEQFCSEVITTFEDTTLGINGILEEIVCEIEENLSREVENFLDDMENFLDLLLLESTDDDPEEENNDDESENQPDSWSDSNWENPPNLWGYNFYMEFQDRKIKPNPSEYPACIGCSNYHGRIYNGNLLICAMHPYGWDDENCPDWEEDVISNK
jgi:hypothetical protein